MSASPYSVVAARCHPLSVHWRREALLRRGLRLEYATLGWNAVEIGFLMYAAVTARSVALAGFALDSMIEIFASLVVVWQLKGTGEAHGERRAVRLIGLAFFALAIYLAAQVAATLALGIRPDSSPLGIVWLAATCLVMLGLAAGEARTGAERPERGSEGHGDRCLARCRDPRRPAAQRAGRLVVGGHRRRDHRYRLRRPRGHRAPARGARMSTRRPPRSSHRSTARRRVDHGQRR